MKFKNLFAALSLMFLMGCASQIMQGYVGHPVSDAVIDYGMPVTAFDIDQNTRAFIWQKTSTHTSPSYVSTYGNSYGNMWSATSYISPAQTSTHTCNYVIYAQKADNNLDGPAGWIITGYKKPSIWCE